MLDNCAPYSTEMCPLLACETNITGTCISQVCRGRLDQVTPVRQASGLGRTATCLTQVRTIHLIFNFKLHFLVLMHAIETSKSCVICGKIGVFLASNN